MANWNKQATEKCNSIQVPLMKQHSFSRNSLQWEISLLVSANHTRFFPPFLLACHCDLQPSADGQERSQISSSSSVLFVEGSPDGGLSLPVTLAPMRGFLAIIKKLPSVPFWPLQLFICPFLVWEHVKLHSLPDPSFRTVDWSFDTLILI